MVLQRYRAKQVQCVVSAPHMFGNVFRPQLIVSARFLQELGKGSFGTVYLTEGRRDKKAYVVKVIRALRILLFPCFISVYAFSLRERIARGSNMCALCLKVWSYFPAPRVI